MAGWIWTQLALLLLNLGVPPPASPYAHHSQWTPTLASQPQELGVAHPFPQASAPPPPRPSWPRQCPARPKTPLRGDRPLFLRYCQLRLEGG